MPRSFIAELMLSEAGLPLDVDEAPRRILDLCTGSGCLAIVAAHMFPDAAVVAADLSRDALAVAEENVTRHGLAQRLTLLQSDLFAALAGERFDLILCNPPYVTAGAVAAFPAEHKAEPVLAHIGGVDGMDLVRRIIDQGSEHLTTNGTLVMEIGQGRAIVERDYPDLPFLWLDTELSDGEVFVLPAAALQDAAKPAQKRPKSRSASSKSRRA